MDILAIIKAIILGVVEGLTEFLPVSSTGHLIIVDKYMKFADQVFTQEFSNTFNIVIQTGAIIAVIIYFRHKVFPQSLEKWEMRRFVSLWCKVIVGVIPAMILGILFGDQIEAVLFNPFSVAIALVFGGVLLLLAEKKNATVGPEAVTDEDVTYKQAILIGLAQCMALWPGMSRSASTIIGGMFFGLSRPIAAEFSFFLAIPTLMGAGLLKGVKAGFDFTSPQWIALAIGTVVSFIVAYFVVSLFMGYIQKKDLKPFAYYRIILGVIIIVNTLWM